MALTQDVITTTRGLPDGEERIPIATGSQVYRGSLAGKVEASGRCKPAAALATERFAGLVVDLEGPDGVGTGLGNTAGTQYAVVQYGHEAKMTVATAIRTNTSLGLGVFIADDESVGGTAVGTAAARVIAGELTEFEASDKSTGWVRLRRAAAAGNIAV